MNNVEVLIVGGGQAGLSASYCLKERGIEHVILERARVGESWRSARWDSFCLVTPNWQCTLPGFHYTGAFKGNDPDGFMVRNEIIHYIESYRRSFDPPLREGVSVRSARQSKAGFLIETSEDSWLARNVIAATGGYHVPKIPALNSSIPTWIQQLHSSTYKGPHQVEEGGVLVVGTGQSGCQIAEDLLLSGKRVYLSVGGAPRSPRWYRGRDITNWLVDMGHYTVTIDTHPLGKAVRQKVNHYLSGRDGGREIDLRCLAARGLKLYGRLDDISGAVLRLKNDLEYNLNEADIASDRIKQMIDQYISTEAIDAPTEPPSERVLSPAPSKLSLDLEAEDIQTIVWATGFKLDYQWLQMDAFDSEGYPNLHRGISQNVPGLYFLGLPWMWTWGSGRFSGVGDDAEYISDHIAVREAL